MAFCDLLRMTVLLAAGAATVLAAVTAIVVGTSSSDTLTLFVAAGWWIIALVGGLVLGRPARAAEAMRPVSGGGTHGDGPAVAGQPDRAALAPPLADRPPSRWSPAGSASSFRASPPSAPASPSAPRSCCDHARAP